MASSLSNHDPAQPNALTIADIIKSIPNLILLLSNAKDSIPLSSSNAINSSPDAANPVSKADSNGNNVAGTSLTSQLTTQNDNSVSTVVGSGSAPLSTANTSDGSVSRTTPTATSGNSVGRSNHVDGNIQNNNNSSERKEDDGSHNGGGLMLGVSDKKQNDTTSKKNDDKGTINNGSSSSSTVTYSRREDYQKLHNQLERLEKDLNFIQIAFEKLKDLELNVSEQFITLQKQGQILNRVVNYIQQPQNGTSAFPTKQFHANIKAITDMVMKLKLQIPSPHKMSLATEAHRTIETVSGLDARNLIDEMLELPSNKKFQDCSAFKDFEESYNSLDTSYRLCLLCFAVFPEGAVVKKRLLMYWWVGEGFIDTQDGGKKDGENEPPNSQNDLKKALAEEVAYKILKKFLEKGFVEPVIRKRRLIGFRMHAWIRYAVISRAEKAGFFNFDRMGNPTADFSSCQRACLVKTEEVYSRSLLIKNNHNLQKNPHSESEQEKLQPEKLRTLFNVNDPYPDFELQWFLRMKNVNVLCLGRWDNSSKKHTEDEEGKRHIEVEGIEFLKGLKNMKYLKYLSLQGVSRVNVLPDTVWNLPNLRILDLNACHNLEALPDKIVSLKNLTHLDISECYLLDCVPKGLESLTNLQVLKGFVISDLKIKHSGSLGDLAGLTKLRKLSIYTSKKEFPTGQELDALRRITGLRKLTIEWGGKSLDKSGTNPTVAKKYKRSTAFKQDNDTGINPQLPEGLEKLDLQCYPGTKAPSWLRPGKLEHLKKLYVRGGNLSDMGQARGGNDKWNVRILHVKFLSELKMDWRELCDAFPNLIYLEKVKCPKLTFFPCDESGVWLNRKLLFDKKLLEELEFSWSFLATRSG
ncbi:hypothetical protein JCGZ_21335 [Jatropha curcas]|uniref:Disease resistance R13L4/SHOC-2-like LRR domain-containing protein n=1 Tax=Jatropha curcas TaxID=180498 RepID=A0A067JMW9_JATCU|nr:disease resistance RPP13-like protein 4 [Jatropha curcas]KDP20864.1 hypothetical protein JCGZ_21335 [Jatropha curcas]